MLELRSIGNHHHQSFPKLRPFQAGSRSALPYSLSSTVPCHLGWLSSDQDRRRNFAWIHGPAKLGVTVISSSTSFCSSRFERKKVPT